VVLMLSRLARQPTPPNNQAGRDLYEPDSSRKRTQSHSSDQFPPSSSVVTRVENRSA
jgi:hypothetical protein